MVKVRDNKEPLVDIANYCPKAINGFNKLRRKFGEKMLARRSVAEMLTRAENNLPDGITLYIIDAWRPKEAQEAYFQAYVRKFSKKHPSWSEERLKREAGVYAINPTNNLVRAGHLTGGAVDVTLAKDGIRIPMKAPNLSHEIGLRLDAPGLPAEIAAARNMLKKCMEDAGFTNYPSEYWHWCFGDYVWAELNNKTETLYGPIE